MSIVITDQGFEPNTFQGTFVAFETATPDTRAVDVPSSTDPIDLCNLLQADMVRIDFPSSADGRGFSLARQLRRLGYKGRLRAKGHVLADQYAMARRVGFDEVEISNELAARQPQTQWMARADWRACDYQARLRG